MKVRVKKMICRIEVEGVDRSGKDTLVGYLDYMSNRQIPISSRGILSTLVYNDIYSRFMSSEREKQLLEGNKETLVVLLYANKKDIEIRCKISKEQPYNIEEHITKFFEYGRMLENNGIKVVYYNTSENTPFSIANEIIALLQSEVEE